MDRRRARTHFGRFALPTLLPRPRTSIWHKQKCAKLGYLGSQMACRRVDTPRSFQAGQAGQAKVRTEARQRPSSQTLHLYMFQSPRAIKHYTCACPSAHGAPNATPVHARVLTDHKTLNLRTFEHSWSIKHYPWGGFRIHEHQNATPVNI